MRLKNNCFYSHSRIFYFYPVKPQTKAHVFIGAANILYGINYAIGKIALKSISPFAIVLVRISVCMILFWVLHAIFIKEKTERRDHGKLILAAFFGVSANQLLFFKGLSLTSEMHSALIMITTPIIVLLMGWLILKDKITWKHVLGILIGAGGVALLITAGASDANSPSNLLGDFCIMLNATSYAIFLVIAKPLMVKYSPFTITKWIFLYGFIMALPFGIGDVIHTNWQTLGTITIISLTYVVFGATFLAYLFNVLGLNFGTPTLVSIYIYVQPVIASIISIALKTDVITVEKIISALLVFTGVALVSFTAKQPNPTQIT